jgi:hypothetical protein
MFLETRIVGWWVNNYPYITKSGISWVFMTVHRWLLSGPVCISLRLNIPLFFYFFRFPDKKFAYISLVHTSRLLCMIGQEGFMELIYTRYALKVSWTVTVPSPVKKSCFTTHIFFRKLDLYTLGWRNLFPVLYSVTFLVWDADVADDNAVPKVKSNYKISHFAAFVMWYDPCRKLQLFSACFSYGR